MLAALDCKGRHARHIVLVHAKNSNTVYVFGNAGQIPHVAIYRQGLLAIEATEH